jgi:SAM-dependent methyltransferase
VFVRDIPTADETHALYGQDYFTGGEYFDYVADRRAAERNFRRNLRVLARFSSGGRLLEIGSAYGFFLHMARSRWEVEGVDVIFEGVRYVWERLGLKVHLGDFLTLDFMPWSYEVVCLWDTIEHLREPDRYVAKANDLLHPGGILAVTTGDIGSRVARFQGRRWRLIHPPTHLHYFTRASLCTLFERHGLRVEEVRYQPQYRSVRLVLYSLIALRRASLRRFFDKMTCLPGMGFTFPLNLRDIMLVVARRDRQRPIAQLAR